MVYFSFDIFYKNEFWKTFLSQNSLCRVWPCRFGFVTPPVSYLVSTWPTREKLFWKCTLVRNLLKSQSIFSAFNTVSSFSFKCHGFYFFFVEQPEGVISKQLPPSLFSSLRGNNCVLSEPLYCFLWRDILSAFYILRKLLLIRLPGLPWTLSIHL